MQAGIIPSLFKLSSHSCYSGSGGLLDRLPLTGVDVVSLDWTVDMADGRRQLGPDVAVQGNGTIRSWKDKWTGNSIMQEAFPTIFNLAQDPDAVIATYKEGTNWNIMLRRDLYDWEFSELLNLLSSLQQGFLNPLAADRLKWG
ncbi:uncharacterized protein LOC132640554 isoform X2 [Lycium barbarum]|uniref:uncharacterized protein LOC132640554 isoform X2 n=1 Tax=Lycium barbarum TaxID=112863 RepID=UPI00293E1F54|nr:uncharacterized protein LOC132640554 isoform X2 [Lycium barbarum]